MPADEISRAFLDYSVTRLAQLQGTISACCDRLSEDQMAHRGADHENSIKNLLLHMTGNLRQWILHGIGNAPDIRERDAEFALEATPSASELRRDFDLALNEAMQVIAAVTPEHLLTIIDPQPTGKHRHPTTLVAIYKVVGHVEHHTGQIIILTKQLAGTDLNLSMPRKR
ncbi:MAG: DinB family protein [Granulicella sp.]